MVLFKCFYFFAILNIVSSQWTCNNDSECSAMEGATCIENICQCGTGRQQVLGGTKCADVSPYYSSECIEDFQCSRLFPGYSCSYEDYTLDSGVCRCLPNMHYLSARCWHTSELGDQCSTNEECMSVLRDPDSLTCQDGVCVCAEGYYLRQRGECRRGAYAPGEGCVLDADCLFSNGKCDLATFTCYDSLVEKYSTKTLQSYSTFRNYNVSSTKSTRRSSFQRISHTTCSDTCVEPFICVDSLCLCPPGYYLDRDGNQDVCLAELGSPATESECPGLFNVVVDGICTCPPNFYHDVNMRDCVKATRRITDSCISDPMCHTFGSSAYCGEPREPWGYRSCQCREGESVYDEELNICRLYAGIGEQCTENSDCLAGSTEIICQPDSEGIGRCQCPEGLEAVGGLCLEAGLGLGDTCQVSQECTGTEHSQCLLGVCTCQDGYQDVNGQCYPEIGGSCLSNSDCAIENTICEENDEISSCQCNKGYVAENQMCWEVQSTYNATCDVDSQCSSFGNGAACIDGTCQCSSTHHFYAEQCWATRRINEECSRAYECFAHSDGMVCRNGLCQCDYEYTYSRIDNSCKSSASTLISNTLVLLLAYIIIHIRHFI